MYAAKMKKNWVKEDKNFKGEGMKKRSKDQKEAQADKVWKGYAKR
jgi:hypothetical protein